MRSQLVFGPAFTGSFFLYCQRLTNYYYYYHAGCTLYYMYSFRAITERPDPWLCSLPSHLKLLPYLATVAQQTLWKKTTLPAFSFTFTGSSTIYFIAESLKKLTVMMVLVHHFQTQLTLRMPAMHQKRCYNLNVPKNTRNSFINFTFQLSGSNLIHQQGKSLIWKRSLSLNLLLYWHMSGYRY